MFDDDIDRLSLEVDESGNVLTVPDEEECHSSPADASAADALAKDDHPVMVWSRRLGLLVKYSVPGTGAAGTLAVTWMVLYVLFLAQFMAVYPLIHLVAWPMGIVAATRIGAAATNAWHKWWFERERTKKAFRRELNGLENSANRLHTQALHACLLQDRIKEAKKLEEAKYKELRTQQAPDEELRASRSRLENLDSANRKISRVCDNVLINFSDVKKKSRIVAKRAGVADPTAELMLPERFMQQHYLPAAEVEQRKKLAGDSGPVQAALSAASSQSGQLPR
jgi:hypothetical protein